MSDKIDYYKAFERLPEITGLPLRRKGYRWYGSCYIDGSPHIRVDKVVARIAPRGDGIQILEAGGECVTLWVWLLKYGGCSTNREVFDRLEGMTSGVLAPKQPILPRIRHVADAEYHEAMKMRKKDAFWRFLCNLWSEEEVDAVMERYNVCSARLRDGRWGTCFWYVDKDGQVCHDKIILYNDDGHRDHGFGGCRNYRTRDGYGYRCMFGEHLLRLRHKGQRVFVVESEKTAILMSLRYPRHIYLACGGVNNLRDVAPDWELLPDFDDAGMMWVEKWPKQCIEWWKVYLDADKGNDMGDMVINEKKNGK